MRYFTNLFTLKTWQEFKEHGGIITGQSENRHSWAQKIEPGDKLLCYLVGAGRWVGVLEVTGKPFLDYSEENRIWQDNLWPSRMPVKIDLEIEPSLAPDAKPDIFKYKVMTNIKESSWGTLFLGSLNQWPKEDGDAVCELINSSIKNPIRRELPPRAFSISKQQTITTETGLVVTVPENPEINSEPINLEKSGTEHTQIQLILAQIGHEMGFDIHIPMNDRNKSFQNFRISEKVPLIEELNLGLIPSMIKVIKNIDVLWIDDDAVVGAFEIESTTSIYSGILRMSDLLSLQPNFEIDCYLVAPDSRENEVFAQVNRPTFVKMKNPFRESCRFIPFSRLISLSTGGMNNLKHQKISYIKEELSDSLLPSEI